MREQGFPAAGGRAAARWGLVLAAVVGLVGGGCAAARTAEAPATAGSPAGSEGRPAAGEAGGDPSPARPMALVSARQKDVVECYEAGLKTHPELAGRVVTRLGIGTDGAVTEAEIVESTLGDPEVEGCITARLRRWRLPLTTEAPFDLEVPWALAPADGPPARANSPSR